MKEIILQLYQQVLKWNVNPIIFICIYLFSFLPFYSGIFLILKGSNIDRITFREFRHFDFSKISIFNSMTISGLLVNRLAWALPYLYIEIFGSNLPVSIHLAVWIWLILGIGFFINRLRQKSGGVAHADPRKK